MISRPQGGVIRVAEVKIQEGESIESALRRFKRKVQQEDIIKDIKKHSFYLKPGDKRRAKQALARKRNRKKLRRELEETDEGATHGGPRPDPQVCGLRHGIRFDRSEEHTSGLQSPCNLV